MIREICLHAEGIRRSNSALAARNGDDQAGEVLFLLLPEVLTFNVKAKCSAGYMGTPEVSVGHLHADTCRK